MTNQQRSQVYAQIDKSSHHLQDARAHLQHANYPEALQAAQHVIELAVKAILDLLDIPHPRQHAWSTKEFAAIAQHIHDRHLLPKLTQYTGIVRYLPRLLLLVNLWGQCYLPAKYGIEIDHASLASPQELFRKEEAALAVQHAEECWMAASELRQVSDSQLAAILAGA